MKTSRSGQREKILQLFAAARGNWVPLPQIQECAAQYNARIFELRRLGFRIANRTKDTDGVRHSWFRLESEPVQPVVARPDSPALISERASEDEDRRAKARGWLSVARGQQELTRGLLFREPVRYVDPEEPR